MRKLSIFFIVLLLSSCTSKDLNRGNVQYTCIHPISVHMKPSTDGQTVWIVLAKEGEFSISDDLLAGNTESSELANKISQSIGSSCIVRTYGIRNHLLSLYPRIKWVSTKNCE